MNTKNKFQQWAEKRRPKKKVKERNQVKYQSKPLDEYEQSINDIDYAWNDFKHEFKFPILILKFIGICITSIVIMWTLSVVEIQNECYLDKRCREWIEKNDK